MSPISEVDGLKAIDDTLSQIEDPTTRDRILRWAWDKYSSEPSPVDSREDPPAKRTKIKEKARKSKAKRVTRTKGSYTIDKNLDLRPKGKTSLKDFIEEKQPKSNEEKCVVSVFYMLNTLELNNVTVDHVYTCFKLMNWRVPANLDNALQLVAFRKGWLDTSSMEDIKVTTHGGNLIEHDLPKKKKD